MLPVHLLLKIFHQLPFKDRARLGGVNRLFRDVSRESIAKMKWLQLTDDLITYSVLSQQSFSSLLQSSSSSLESIIANDWSCNKLLFKAVSNYIYPKLKHIEISVIDNEQTKRLISQSPNLRSVVLHLVREFEWPENIVYEKLEKLEIRMPIDCNSDVDLSPILAPLHGKIPNLKQLTIINSPKSFGNFLLSVQEFSRLVTSTSNLEELNLQLPGTPSKLDDFVMAFEYWRFPKMTSLYLDLESSVESVILHMFSASFPHLKSLTSQKIKAPDGLAVFSELAYLRELRLPNLEVTKEEFTEMVNSMPMISVLQIKALPSGEIINDRALVKLSLLKHLREFSICKKMTQIELINIIANVPSMAILEIWTILDASSPKTFLSFVSSSATIRYFKRNLEIRMRCMLISGIEAEWNQMKAAVEIMMINGGPVVKMEKRCVESIRYGSLVGLD